MLNKKKKLESGRSMVEMLGVLAIIGVLSVGGIAGYTMAMNKYRANEILNGASMMYMLGMASNQGNGTAELTYSGTIGSVPTGASEITYTNKTVVVKIQDASVCDQVKNQLGDKVSAGDCETATSGVYSLTITLSEADTTGGDIDCSQCPSTCPTGCGKVMAADDFYAANKTEASNECKKQIHPGNNKPFLGAFTAEEIPETPPPSYQAEYTWFCWNE